MVLNTRPEWTRATTGIPIDCVVRVYGGTQGTRQDINTSRTRVSLVRPGALQAKPEDEFDFSFVYGPEATNGDVASRSVMPLLRKFVEGYNVTIVTFGATGAGKTTTLEGSRAKNVKGSADGDGIVHAAIDELFKLLSQKAVAVGDIVAQKRRMPTAKAFDFFVESSFVEIYNEQCHDMYQKGAAVQASLPVYEDDMEGYQVSGLTYRMAKNEAEMRQSFNFGRTNRDMQMTDLGSVHERAAAVFTIHLSQFAPASVPGEEDRVMCSKIQFVDMPGAERLGMEAELLRLREGVLLNKGLLGFASVLRALAEAGPGSGFVNYEECLLTRLLADGLGGNALSLVIGNIRQGDWEQSSTTLKQLQVAKQGRNYPMINHGRARGLLQKLRHRLLTILEDRETLRDQLHELPADGDPNAVAISIAKVRDLEARLLAEREEKAHLMEEKQALQARLSKLREAGTGDLQERSDLQEALIKSEELRLALAKALIDAQLEFNDKETEWINEKHELEKKVVELEAGHMERYVRAEDAAALEQERDQLNSQLLAAQDDITRKDAAIEALKQEVDELKAKLRKAEHELNMIGGEGQWPPGMHGEMEDDLGGLDPTSLEAKRRQLFHQLKAKERRIQELNGEVTELNKEIDRLRNQKMLTQTGVDEMREAYRRKLETMMRDIADMSRAVAIMQADRSTGLKVTPEDLFNTFQKLTDENMRITEERERELRADVDELHGRNVELRRKFRSLYLAYRQLRYIMADQWPHGSNPPNVPTEDSVLGAAIEDINRSEEEADRRMMARLRERAAQLGTQLGALKIVDAASASGISVKPAATSMLPREQAFDSEKFVDAPQMLQLENDRLKEELDRVKRVIGTPVERVRQENTQLAAQLREMTSDKSRAQMAQELAASKQEVDRLRRQLAGGGGGAADKNGSVQSVNATIRELANKSQAELERKLQHEEARRIMAEEQLESLNKYLTQATVQYQREIVRLRAIIGQVDPEGKLLRTNPIRGM